MSFEIDNQTAQDLDLFSKQEGSILQHLNYTNTVRGELLLIEKLKHPISNFKEINNRIKALQYFYDQDLKFPILQKDVEFIEYYLTLEFKHLNDSFFEAISDKIKSYYVSKNNYYLIDRGISCLIRLFNVVKVEISKIKSQNSPVLLKSIFQEIEEILNKPTIALSQKLDDKNINFRKRNKLDKAFRHLHKKDIKRLLDLIYEWDVLQSLKLAMKKNGFNLPKLIPFTNQPILEFIELFHPVIINPTKNNLSLKGSTNLCFLTGPNMSGKSTLLKAIGISIHLAHLGFPVPAKSMTFTPFQGMITSINLSDNINLGYSHFFSEVKRIKYITEQLTIRKNLIVIIDEMFRGTNVEEAHYGTHLVSSAFSNISSSIFFVSSHIVEVAEKFKGNDYIALNYLEGNISQSENNYKLKKGISNKKLGKKILENQGVIDALINLKDRE